MLKEGVSITVLILLLVIIPFSTAGFFSDTYNKITGKATTQVVDLNITVTSGSAPTITFVYNGTMTDVSSGPSEGPSATSVEINFSASDADGYANLNDSSATMNFSYNGETARLNTTCIRKEVSGNLANYSCTVEMWWFDVPGTWNITASISDFSSNSVSNATRSFSLGTTAGFLTSPTNLTWSSINPGAVDQEPNEYMTLNNTGNLVRNVEVNSTNLYGEDNAAYALWAANFSSHTAAGCGGTSLVEVVYTDVSGASAPIGNYTINDGTGQEDIYYCLEAANADLIAQAYSTSTSDSWTVQIVA